MKRVAVIPNTKKDVSLSLTAKIVDILSSGGAEVLLPESVSESGLNATYLSKKNIFDSADCVVTVGGDGTILGIAESVSQRDIPVIGVNLGRMGFMAELEPDELDLLLNVINGSFTVEKRMMLDVKVVRNGETVSTYRALNDIVVSKGSISKIAELDLYCNGTCVSHFNSD